MSNDTPQDADPSLITAFNSAQEAAFHLGRLLAHTKRHEIQSMLDLSAKRARTHLLDALAFLDKHCKENL